MKHYHKNPRQITDRQFKDLKMWLAELGDLSGIVHDLNSDESIGGNMRLEAMGLMGATPVITETFDTPTEQGTVAVGYFAHSGERYAYRAVRWTAEQCEKANIVANKAGGSWDFDVLANQWELDELLEWGFEESELQLDWGKDETPDPGAQVDKAAELQEKWQVERGQVWQVGRHRVMCGDSTCAEDVRRLMGGERADLFLTSPPYGGGENAGYKTDYSGETKRFYTHDLDKMTPDEWLVLCNGCLNQAAKIMRSGESPALLNVMYNANNRRGYGRLVFCGGHPFQVHETVCWDKAMGFPSASKGILSRNWELIFVLSCGETYFSTQSTNEVRWAKWDIKRPQEQSESHKACFPVALAERALIDFSVDGSTAYDPFTGSGTTLVACEQTNRIGYGMEIEPRYVSVTLERLQGMGLEARLLKTDEGAT